MQYKNTDDLGDIMRITCS